MKIETMNPAQNSNGEEILRKLYTPVLLKILKLGEKVERARGYLYLSIIGYPLDLYLSKMRFSWLILAAAANLTISYIRLSNARCPRCKGYYFASLLWSESVEDSMRDIAGSKCDKCGLVFEKYI